MGWLEETRERETVERRRNHSLGVKLSGYIAFNRRVTEGVCCYLALSSSRPASTACVTTEYDHRFSKSSFFSCFSLLGFFLFFLTLLFIFSSLDVTDPRRLKQQQQKSCFRSLTYTIKRESC